MTDSDCPLEEETEQDFYEASLDEIARQLGIDPSPFHGAPQRYGYQGAKDDLHKEVRRTLENRHRAAGRTPP